MTAESAELDEYVDDSGIDLPVSREQLISALSPLGFLLAWELLVIAGLLPETWFPRPSVIAVTTVDLIGDQTLVDHTITTVRRLIGAFLLAAIPGVTLGLVIGINRTARAIMDPIVSFAYPMPKIALLPLIIIIFGFGDTSIIVAASITAFFIIMLNTAAGVQNIDDVLLEAAENFHATGFKKFYKVILPGAMPLIFTGLRLGLGLALIVTIAAEFIASESGLGFFIFNSWQILQVTNMFAGFFVIAVLGFVSTAGLERLGAYLMPWQERDTVR
jgi:ABC-type nitrate/sulfonate/bicarbonate transport system permease component